MLRLGTTERLEKRCKRRICLKDCLDDGTGFSAFGDVASIFLASILSFSHQDFLMLTLTGPPR